MGLDRPPKITELDPQQLGVDEDVFGLQIPQDDLLRVQVLDSPDDLPEDVGNRGEF